MADRLMHSPSLAEELFAPVDRYFAEAILLEEREEGRELLLCYLLAAARSGHLCVSMDGNRLEPSPLFITTDVNKIALLQEKIIAAADSLPSSLCSDVYSEEAFIKEPLCRYKNAMYLQKNWGLETQFLFHLKRLMSSSLERNVTENPCVSDKLNQKQAEAALKALYAPVSIISGGPGTGKSFTAVEIIKTFLASLPPEQRENVSVKAAAPTGKAAAHLQRNILQHFGPLKGFECGTLHSLLKIRAKESFKKSDAGVFADLFLIDEASMLDARMFSRLLSCLRGGGRLVLMGDKDQLPPVESGGFFSDLITFSESSVLPVTILTQSLRVERQELFDLAHSILLGNVGTNSMIRTISSGEVGEIREYIWDRCRSMFFWPADASFDYQRALESAEKFRVLSCIRKGPLGVDSLNAMIVERFLEEVPFDKQWAVPILITENEYSSRLVNGDMGLLVADAASLKRGRFEAKDKVYFIDKEREGTSLRCLSAAVLPSFEFGYCLSVHKSQGSEYETVVVLAPLGSESFGKEVLYTAVTRAKKELFIVAEESVLPALLNKSSKKISGLNKRLAFSM